MYSERTLSSLRLRKYREQKGWSQQRLAEETQRCDENNTGLTARTISNYEQGRTFPKLENLILLCKALGVNMSILYPLSPLIFIEELLKERIDLEIEAASIFVDQAKSEDFKII